MPDSTRRARSHEPSVVEVVVLDGDDRVLEVRRDRGQVDVDVAVALVVEDVDEAARGVVDVGVDLRLHVGDRRRVGELALVRVVAREHGADRPGADRREHGDRDQHDPERAPALARGAQVPVGAGPPAAQLRSRRRLRRRRCRGCSSPVGAKRRRVGSRSANPPGGAGLQGSGRGSRRNRRMHWRDGLLTPQRCGAPAVLSSSWVKRHGACSGYAGRIATARMNSAANSATMAAPREERARALLDPEGPHPAPAGEAFVQRYRPLPPTVAAGSLERSYDNPSRVPERQTGP